MGAFSRVFFLFSMARQAHAGRFVSCAKYVANIRSLPLRGFRAAQKQGRPTKVGSAQSL